MAFLTQLLQSIIPVTQFKIISNVFGNWIYVPIAITHLWTRAMARPKQRTDRRKASPKCPQSPPIKTPRTPTDQAPSIWTQWRLSFPKRHTEVAISTNRILKVSIWQKSWRSSCWTTSCSSCSNRSSRLATWMAPLPKPTNRSRARRRLRPVPALRSTPTSSGCSSSKTSRRTSCSIWSWTTPIDSTAMKTVRILIDAHS